MGFSFLTQELAMDLGTANTVILQDGKIVVDEPSVIAFDQTTGKAIAVGQKAKLMYEKTHPNIKTVRPLRDGVIADFNAAEQMIRGFVKMINYRRSFFTPNLKMVICIPKGSTEVEIRAVRDSAEHAGARDIYMIFEPMAAAMGIGLDVNAPAGNMVVDIGGGTSEIAVISLGGIVTSQSIRVAGDVFTSDIQQYMRQQHNIKVGEITSEEIKVRIGAAIPCLDKSVAKIEAAVLQVLEQTPPELYQDIVQKGIFLTGGGALLRGLDKRLYDKINIPFHVGEDPLRAVARGTSIALRNPSQYPFLMR